MVLIHVLLYVSVCQADIPGYNVDVLGVEAGKWQVDSAFYCVCQMSSFLDSTHFVLKLFGEASALYLDV